MVGLDLPEWVSRKNIDWDIQRKIACYTPGRLLLVPISFPPPPAVQQTTDRIIGNHVLFLWVFVRLEPDRINVTTYCFISNWSLALFQIFSRASRICTTNISHHRPSSICLPVRLLLMFGINTLSDSPLPADFAVHRHFYTTPWWIHTYIHSLLGGFNFLRTRSDFTILNSI